MELAGLVRVAGSLAETCPPNASGSRRHCRPLRQLIQVRRHTTTQCSPTDYGVAHLKPRPPPHKINHSLK